MKYLELIRIRQWYKNLIVFLALFFSGNLFDMSLVWSACVAFLSVSFVSSTYYIINDIKDKKKDTAHPEKKHRSLASGKISTFSASILAVILFVLGIILAGTLSMEFMHSVFALFGLGILYTFLLKDIILVDVLTIATLFVIRAIAGAVAIDVVVSPWLILVPFFLSLFLSIGKRHADVILLKGKGNATRKVLSEYNPTLTHSLMNISTTLLILSYALYSFLSEFNSLLYTLPFALFVVFRFYQLIVSGSEIARHPEKVMRDRKMIIGMILWTIVAVILIYG